MYMNRNEAEVTLGRSAEFEAMVEEWSTIQEQNAGFVGATLLQSLANLPDPPPSVRRLQLWSHPILMGVVVFLLGVFWVGRKIIGLI